MFTQFKKARNQQGFTLVELVIVIAILGILATIAIPKLTGFRDNAILAADKASAATIAKAAELHATASDLSEEDKSKLTIKELENKDLIDKDTKPQHKDHKLFHLNYTKSNGIFTVSYGEDSEKTLYPDNMK
ncbi:MAG TPA: type II secretion system protein [Tissierellaceae bacterium]|nr:type II secretion system protein [Tissierellaceae bacterium]